MLMNLFKDYLAFSAQLRPSYPASLAEKKDNWKYIVSMVDSNIPRLYQVIYDNVSGTRRDIKNQKLMDFIPGYRLIHIDELLDEKKSLDKMIASSNGIDNEIIIPLLANYSSDFICYLRTVNGDEIIVNLFHDDCEVVLMHKSVEKFLETICEFYKENVYYLDDDGYLDYDIIKEGEIGAKLNNGVSYWLE
ncbi:SMI1/KNR4 family protein [Clostridium sp. DJ247]|uniref:SMI1/KNR4 family protein n=1 Tax=Clostridium sp. DJ247 TaxID=2726188 RepID=UPI001627CBE6|nr:SMI1/KNR4 family protein [Clostridium sp. DJ247]MBC2582896.1 SMI1/KNR4 family protein [Clostridium sp. DJ247]